MEFKYPEGINFKIINLDGIKSQWKFPEAGSCSNDCDKAGSLKVGEFATLKYNLSQGKYYLKFDDDLESDYMSEREIEIMMGKEFVKQYQEEHIVKSKPPLGVIPKDIYEYKRTQDRIQDLARAIHEYIDFGTEKYDLLIGWTDELLDRLYELKKGCNK